MLIDFARLRDQMVDRQLAGRGITDERVLAAMRRVPREHFISRRQHGRAYDDGPLPIGCGQTISQPYIVALMLQHLCLTPASRLLEIGTGSGYAAAVAAEIVAEVFTIERHGQLAAQSRERLAQAGYGNLHVRHGNGYRGWPESAPFEAILVSAGSLEVPAELVDQLAPGGRLVIPVGTARYDQRLLRISKSADGEVHTESLDYVAFVPLVDARAVGPSPD
ncbi:protein-L-isoaspartate(D-aspartate) O-methyltransferase [bacterium]|nr:protein-L-isoaspartate(D-aspartate) O-methyltransferase [bacterium]